MDLYFISTADNASSFEIASYANSEATQRWRDFDDDALQPGCLVTVLGKKGDALEYHLRSTCMHYERVGDLAISHQDDFFPEHEPTKVLVSGRCLEPGCPDYGHCGSCFLVPVA